MRLPCCKKRISPMGLFLLVSAAGIFAFFIVMVPRYGTEAFRWLVMEHNWNFQFADYYRPVIVSEDLSEVYTNGVNMPYPPLSFLIFHLLWKLGPTEAAISWKEWPKYEAYQYNSLTFLMLTIITAVLMSKLIRRILTDYRSSQVCIFTLLILLSAPFYQGVIERGNMAFLCLVLLLFSVCFRNSENGVMRELSLIFIAVAAGIKIYPAVFGLLYLKEKRWKEACRLIGYGLAFFFIPFFITGGLSGVSSFLGRLKWFSERELVGSWTSIRAFLTSSCDYLGLNWNVGLIGKALENLFAVLAIIMTFAEPKDWKRALYLCGIMAVYSARTFRYNAIFMLIPLLLFLAENGSETKRRKIDYIYAFLFATSFSIPVWAINREVDFAIFFPIYLILLLGILETTACFIKEHLLKMSTAG